MSKKKLIYTCRECGHQEPKWLGRCPGCGSWNSFAEELSSATGAGGAARRNGPGGGSSGSDGRGRRSPNRSIDLDRVEVEGKNRFPSGIEELDRVLGGGIMNGSAVLIGGEPGIGKSTLMMQLASKAAGMDSALGGFSSPGEASPGAGSQGAGQGAGAGKRSFYISGEESASQVKMRADRIGADTSAIELFCESDLDKILSVLREKRPKLVIVDSIQTLISVEAGQVPGTVNQLKYGCHELIDWARENGSALFLVAHVTKEGSIAGPKVIEHMVDTVLYFDLADGGLRIVRSTKNRFGSVDELGLFSMDEKGLHQVTDPGALFLVRRGGDLPPGIAAVPVYEGSRVLMVELQALTVPAKGGYSRVYSERIDPGRVSRIAAVLERHLSLRFSDHDIYVNVAGGIRIAEVGVELALAMALYSARTGIPLPAGVTVAGEVSLAGEVRPTGHLARRIKSAAELGFTRFIGPAEPGIKGLNTVSTISEAVKALFGAK